MNKKVIASFMAMVMVLSMMTGSIQASAKGKSNYSKYNNTKCGFGLSLNTSHKKPGYSKARGVSKLSKYNAYYMNESAAKKKKKVIYLTFDCGYENGHTKRILNILKKNKIKAIFFVTEPYIRSNPKLVKRMKKEGHLVGNHTCTHPQLPTRSVTQIKKEVNNCAKTMKKLTGYKMDKYIRPPEGCYSQRTLKVLQDMGYATMFWSLAWHDWDPKHQPGKTAVVKKFKKYYHPGMMPLIHVVSQSDTQALPDVIKFMKKKGYRFGEVTDFALRPGEKKSSSQTNKKAAESVSVDNDK